jgi:hypothetical protein
MSARVLVATVAAFGMLVPGTSHAQFGGFGGPGFGQQELQIVGMFDKDGDKRLNDVERRAARQYLEQQRYGGRQRFGGFGAANVEQGRAMSPSEIKPPYPATPLYDAGTVRTLFLEFPTSDWERELSTFYNTDVEVPATVIVDGKKYPDVGIHFRGNSSYRMVPEGYKRSLNLSFDYLHKKLDLRGYTTLNLLNSHEDPTYLRTILSQEIARDYLPALRSNFVHVVINGESWGIYVNNEQFNKDFLQEWFKTTEGARWKVPGSPRGRGGLEYWGDNLAQYRRVFEIKSKDTPKAWSDLIKLTKVLNETPADTLEAALAPILDVDGVLRFLAIDLALNNGDGYWTRASDYVLYQDPQGRFHILPGDMNETFADGGRGFGFGGTPPSPTLDPLIGMSDTTKPLRSKLLAVPSLRAKYLGYVKDIATRWLDWKKLGPLAERYQMLIAADVKADTRKLDGFEEFPVDFPGAGDFRSFVERRRAYLLAYPPH